MTSLLRVQANRLNALQSTGPRTLAGKAVSRGNAVKHGLRTWKPVLLPNESVADWNKFGRALFAELQPVGQIEILWAGRAAVLMWRLQRSADARKTLIDQQWREAYATAPESAWWQHLRRRDQRFPASVEGVRRAIAKSSREITLLQRVIALPAGNDPRCDASADPITACDLITWASGHLATDAQLQAASVAAVFPGIGSLAADPDPEQYDWSLGMVRDGLTQVAAWTNATCGELFLTLLPAMQDARRAMRAALRRGEREMRRFRQCAAARAPEIFQKFDRYEAKLERAIAAALSQLRALQSQRRAESSLNEKQVSSNVVHVGFAAMEIQEKQG